MANQTDYFTKASCNEFDNSLVVRHQYSDRYMGSASVACACFRALRLEQPRQFHISFLLFSMPPITAKVVFSLW